MRIAIVGGIGSGKSEVLKTARSLGIFSLSADEINAELLNSPEYIAQIESAFPSAVSHGAIDKKVLANIVFSDSAERAKLNAIAHPQILNKITEATQNPIVVEMPLLFECGAQDMFDEIVLVHTPFFKRLRRLRHRGISTGEAIKRIRAQVKERSLNTVATRIVDNSGSIEELHKNAEAVFKDLLTENKL